MREKGPQARSARWFFTRPLLGRVSARLFASLATLALVRFLVALRIFARRSLVLPACVCSLASPVALVAAIDPNPDYGAFRTGLEVVTFTALITVSVFMVVGFIRRKLGE